MCLSCPYPCSQTLHFSGPSSCRVGFSNAVFHYMRGFYKDFCHEICCGFLCGFSVLRLNRNCLKHIRSNSVPSRLLPNSCLLNPGRSPKSNRTPRSLSFPGSKGKATKFVRTRGFSKLSRFRNTENLVNPLFWTWTWLKHFRLKGMKAPKRSTEKIHTHTHTSPWQNPRSQNVGCTPRGSCNDALLRRVLRRSSNSKCFLEGFLEGACEGFQQRQGSQKGS